MRNYPPVRRSINISSASNPIILRDYKQQLEAAKWPTSVLCLDFETFFDKEFSLSKLTHAEYILDSRFKPLMLASCEVEGRASYLWGASKIEFFLNILPWDRLTISFHNAPFDAFILARRYGIYPKYILDTLDLARAWDVESPNDVGELSQRYGLLAKGEVQKFVGLTEENATPEQIGAMGTYACRDVSNQSSLVEILLPKLTNAAQELPLMQQTIELWTKPSIACDMKLGEMLKKEMSEEAGKAINRLGLSVIDISNGKKFDAHLEGALAEVGDSITKYQKINKRMDWVPALAKDDSEREILLNHPSERVRNLVGAKIGRRSWPIHIKRVTRICTLAALHDMLMPVPLGYHKAHTGRDGGAELINLQNLPRKGHHLIVLIRGLLVAIPGWMLVRIDLSAIEPRVLFWLAGQEDGLEDFRAFDKKEDKFDIYQKFASECLNKELLLINDSDRSSIGKVGVLGCGYGMGAALPGHPELPNQMFLENKLTLETSTNIVRTYRNKYKKVTGFWYNLERAFKFVADKKLPAELGKLLLYHHPDCDVVMRLPSGRELHYHKVMKQNDRIYIQNGTTSRWAPIWGGTLVENATQAVARDVLMYAGLRIDRRGVRVALRVHDEVVCHVERSKIPEAREILLEEMGRVPEWAPGLPLASKVKVAYRYEA